MGQSTAGMRFEHAYCVYYWTQGYARIISDTALATTKYALFDWRFVLTRAKSRKKSRAKSPIAQKASVEKWMCGSGPSVTHEYVCIFHNTQEHKRTLAICIYFPFRIYFAVHILVVVGIYFTGRLHFAVHIFLQYKKRNLL